MTLLSPHLALPRFTRELPRKSLLDWASAFDVYPPLDEPDVWSDDSGGQAFGHFSDPESDEEWWERMDHYGGP